MDEPDYLAQAMKIVNGDTLLLAQREHVLALHSQMSAANRNIIALGEILLCILTDNGVPAMQIPAAMLAKVRTLNAIPTIQRQEDGAVVVRLTPMGGPMVALAKGVM